MNYFYFFSIFLMPFLQLSYVLLLQKCYENTLLNYILLLLEEGELDVIIFVQIK